MGTFVIGYDGSDGARNAIHAAKTFDATTTIVVTATAPTTSMLLASTPVISRRATAEELEEAQAASDVADEGAALAREAGLEATAVSRAATNRTGIHGVLVEVAREHDAQAIVVGRHGASRVGAVLLGSVSSGLIRHSDVPVLVIPASGR